MFDKRYSGSIVGAWCDVFQLTGRFMTNDAVRDKPVTADHEPAANNFMVRLLSNKVRAIVVTDTRPGTLDGLPWNGIRKLNTHDNIIEVSCCPVNGTHADNRLSNRTANSRAASNTV